MPTDTTIIGRFLAWLWRAICDFCEIPRRRLTLGAPSGILVPKRAGPGCGGKAVPEPVSSRSWASWLPAFLKPKASAAPVAPPAPAPAPVGHGIMQGPPPRGPRQGTLVAVSVYQPFGADLGTLVAGLVTLGYSNLEVREAQHEATKSRVSASARIPVLDATEDQVRAALRAAIPPAHRDARIDVDIWPTY